MVGRPEPLTGPPGASRSLLREVFKMSKEAVQLVKDEIGDEGQGDFDMLVGKIKNEFGVKEKTAASYIYEAEELEHQWSPDGSSHIVKTVDPADQTTTTGSSNVLEGFDGKAAELKMEAGEPSGQKYEYLEVLKDNGHPLVPDSTDYYRRRLEGHKSDIQVFTYDLSADTPAGTQNLLLTGLPGVGKNQAIKHICAETNRPFVRIPVGGGIRYEDLVGHYTPTAEGDLEWTDGILTTAVRYGFMVVLDEVNMMTGDVSSPLHQVTESGENRELVIRQTGEVIEPHPEFKVVATRNPNFAGANQMNRAFLSRFSEHELDFLNKDAEVRVLTSQVPGLEEDEIEPVVEYANELRSRYPQEIGSIVTTRDLKRVGGYIAGGLFDTKTALRKVLLPRMDPDTDRDPVSDEIDMKF